MNNAVLIGLVMTVIGYFPNKGNVIYPLVKRDLLLFLNSNDWKLTQLCLNGNCEEIIDGDTHPFGIDTENVVPNYCTSEKGDFYTIGKYYWQIDPVTFEKSEAIFSDPDYFKLSESGANGNKVKIKLCTPNGYYSGILKIIDTTTIQIIANRPEYENKQVIQVYKKN
jgi:hypothetical protein